MPHFRVSSALGSTITTTIIWQFNTPTWSIFIHSLCALLHIEILCINFFLPLFCAQRFHQWLVIELTTLSNYAFYCPPPLCQPFFEKKCSLSFAPSSPPKKKRVHNCLIFFFFFGASPGFVCFSCGRWASEPMTRALATGKTKLPGQLSSPLDYAITTH